MFSDRQMVEPEFELEKIRALVRERVRVVQEISPFSALGVIPVVSDTNSLAGSTSYVAPIELIFSYFVRLDQSLTSPMQANCPILVMSCVVSISCQSCSLPFLLQLLLILQR
jgi:hypothetical protein